jgi:nitrile hydratase
MNGVHDMGGMHGFGPVKIDWDFTPKSLSEWEKRVDLLLGATMRVGIFNIDAFRFGIEQMEPARYLATPYFGRWAASVEWNLIREGVITLDELDAWVETLRSDPVVTPTPGAKPFTPPDQTPGKPLPPIQPRFAVGDQVITRNVHPTGHTRLPRYARGKPGVIERVYEAEPFADDRADNKRVPMQHTYRVRFDARDLWGESAEPNAFVTLDLYDSYLEPAETA